MNLSAALENLHLQMMLIARSPLARPIDPGHELRRLHRAKEELGTSISLRYPNDPEDLISLRKECQKRRYNLWDFNHRKLRLMCHDKELLDVSGFITSLSELAHDGKYFANLALLAHAYFLRWPSPDHAIWEELLHILASRELPGDIYKRYHSDRERIFSKNADKLLAELADCDNRTLEQVFVDWGVPPGKGLANAAFAALMRRRLSQLEAAKPYSSPLPILTSILRDLEDQSISRDLFYEVTRRLILCPYGNSDDAFKKQLEHFLMEDKRLGDPRIPANSPHWTGVGSEATQRVRAWRSRMDLLFFFDAVMRGIEGHPLERKEFWLQYIDQVESSVVALCPRHRIDLRGEMQRNKIDCSKIRDSKLNSCFMMRFRNKHGEEITAIEFSRVGKARVFRGDAFKTLVGDIYRDEFRLDELLVSDNPGLGVFSVVHAPPGGWQRELTNVLAGVGVRRK